MQAMLLNFGRGSGLPLIRQAEAAECGLACLAMIAGHHGRNIDMPSLRRRFPISLKGATLHDIMQVANALDLTTRALRVEPEEFSQLRLPCVLHWEFRHFVVLARVGRGHVVILDPALGERKIRDDELNRSFTGVALELTPGDAFEKRRERQSFQLFNLIRFNADMIKALAQGIALSLLLELFVILSPFYMQLVVDEAILKGDNDLLLGLSAAFTLVFVFNAAAGAFRSFVFRYLGNTMAFEMQTRMFHHLIRLPLEWFQKRKVGDVVQRFHGLEPVRQLIVDGGISAAIDGSLAIFVAIFMLQYSVQLSFIAFGTFALYAVLRIATRRIAQRLQLDAVTADAKEQTHFLETLRAIQTIKVSSGEIQREGGWHNLFAEKLNTLIRMSTLQIWFTTAVGLLGQLSDVVVIYIAARQVLAGQFSVGMITAFMAYKSQFFQRVTGILDQWISYLLLDVHLDRVADIALAQREANLLSNSNQGFVLSGHIELRDLGFRYGPQEKDIFSGIGLEIAPGQCAVIFGPSGAGKSTLLKLLTGLMVPTGGDVLFDGMPVSAIGLDVIRPQLGIVMQEEQLIAGTVAENIALFDAGIDMDRVREAARLAAIESDIMQFPMQFNSLVGDMGTALSSGQKQCVLLARALYRRPRMLVLDEGTAHIDPDRATAIWQAIAAMPITRIIVAHTPQPAAIADRVFVLVHGRLLERPKPAIAA